MKLKMTRTLLLTFTLGIILSSCQKEVSFQTPTGQQPGGNGGGNGGGTNNIDIKGNWNFVGLYAKTYVGISVSDQGQSINAITTSDYITEDNTGGLVVSDNQFVFTGIGHSVNDEAHVMMYLNGILFDESDEPFAATYPPTDYTLDYVRNNNDSITYANSFAMIPDPSGGSTTVPAGPLGARISVANDTLSVTIKNASVQNITQQGVPATVDSRLDGTMKFKRQ